MESAENQMTGNALASGDSAARDETARDLGQRADNAAARFQLSSAEATSEVKSKLGSTLERLSQKRQVAAKGAKSKLVVAKERTATKAKDYRVNVEHEVQAQPLKSVAYAFGAGAVVGLLLGRSRR